MFLEAGQEVCAYALIGANLLSFQLLRMTAECLPRLFNMRDFTWGRRFRLAGLNLEAGTRGDFYFRSEALGL
jgi:hypothetical protein